MRDSHGPDELISLQFPNRVNLILPRLAKLEKWRLGIGHLSQPPLDAGELATVAWPTRFKGSAFELQLVQWKTVRAGIDNGRRFGNICELRLILKVVVAVAVRITVTDAPSPSVRIGHKPKHVLHHALVILAIEPSRPRAAAVALALRRNIKLPTMTTSCSRMVIPHELININKGQRGARRIDKACMLVDELANLTTGRRVIVKQQVE